MEDPLSLLCIHTANTNTPKIRITIKEIIFIHMLIAFREGIAPNWKTNQLKFAR